MKVDRTGTIVNAELDINESIAWGATSPERMTSPDAAEYRRHIIAELLEEHQDATTIEIWTRWSSPNNRRCSASLTADYMLATIKGEGE